MPVEGILPVVPTPFRDERFDPASFQRLLAHALPAVDGFTVLGSTGEAPSLPVARRQEIAERMLALAPAEVTMVVGVSHTSLDDTIALARHAQDHGAGAVLCSVPYYFANDPDGIARHLARLDAVLEIELVLYDNPVATKTTLRPDWVVDWAERLEHLNSVKLTDHDLDKVAAWRAAGLTVLAGDDPILFQYLTAGVDGAMVIAPAVLPQSFRAVWDRLRDGAVATAHAIFATELAPFLHAFGIGEEIATTKELLAAIGVFSSPELLSPLSAADPARRAILRQAYDLGVAAQHAREATDREHVA